MSRLVGFGSHRFDLGTGEHGPEWLLIRDKLSYFERQKMHSALLDIEISQAGESTMTADVGKYQIAILRSYVAGWQVFDDNGSTVPFSAEALARLDDETAEAAVKHIDGISKGNEEKKETMRIIEGQWTGR